MWSLMRRPRLERRVTEEYDLPALTWDDLRRLFPGKSDFEIGATPHTITEAQRAFFEEMLGQPLDLERFVFQLIEWRED